MAHTLAQKIIAAHLVGGEMVAGQEIALEIDQTLTQDTTGTMVWLEFEAMGLPRVRTERSVAYIDHNLIQADFRPSRQRHLPPGASGALCRAGQDAAGLR